MSSTAVRVGIGVLGLALAASACGGQVKMGAAATFDNGRISTAALDDDVQAWTKEFTATPVAGQVRQQVEQSQGNSAPWDSTSPSRSTLQRLVDLKVWDEAAVEQGITVTDTEVDRVIQDNGGANWLKVFPLALGLPQSKARAYAREVAIQRAILTNSGQPLTAQITQAQYNLLTSAYAKAITALNVKVNPRYGSRFPLLSDAGRVTYHLSKPDPGLSGAS